MSASRVQSPSDVPPPSPAWFADVSREARSLQADFGALVGERLSCDAYSAVAACARTLGHPYFDAEALNALVPDFERLPFSEAERRGLLLANDAAGRHWLLCADPFDAARLDWAEARVDAVFAFGMAATDDIRALLKRYEASLTAAQSVLAALGSDAPAQQRAAAQDLTLSRIAEDASPIVRLVNSMLYDALRAEASDVHLESDTAGLVIRYRVDGVLEDAGRVDSRSSAEQVISRIKVLAELDIAERRLPQDGRFNVRIEHRDIDLRVSIMPAVHGEDAVIRILDKRRLSDAARGLRFSSLGFDDEAIAALLSLARQPYGLLLVTGPTGSGKTTTLYAALNEVRTGREKIITVEDPVEYQLAGVVQVPVNEKRGLTFSRGLRSILRHDPDTIMVGEIRDGETGQIAVQAALTGHLVFTTVHANSVFDVLGRMLHIGVDPFNLVAALNGVVAQRLLRMSCVHCLESDAWSLDALPAGERAVLAAGTPMRGRGCGHCRGTGYRGRRAIAEVLVLDDALRDMISARTSIAAVKEMARERGVRSMRRAGLECVARGLTTLDELNRVTFAEDDGGGG